MSLELGAALADYLGLNELETDYLFLLIELARAGSFRLEQMLKRRISKAQSEARKLDVRLSKDTDLSDATKSGFDSNWIYSGIRNGSSFA